jgi:hypothetical protein
MLAETKVKERKPKKIDPEKLREYVTSHPDGTSKQIGATFGASDVAVSNEIRRLSFTYKKTFLYKERDENERQEFRKFIGKEPVKNLVFIDESGTNHEEIRKHAWSKRGVKIIGERSGAESHRRTSIVAGLYCGEVIAPFYSQLT